MIISLESPPKTTEPVWVPPLTPVDVVGEDGQPLLPPPPARRGRGPLTDAERAARAERMKGHHNRNLRKGTEKLKVAKKIKVRDLANLICREGKSMREAAGILGVSYNYVVGQLWPMVKDGYGPGLDDPAEREAIASFVVQTTKRVVQEAASRVTSADGGAAYGAVALKGAAQLAEWYGLAEKLNGDGDGKSGLLQDLESIAQSVMEASPALAGKIEHLARIRERQALAALPEPADEGDGPAGEGGGGGSNSP